MDRAVRRTFLAILTAAGAHTAAADEAGVSFWLPGNFGSFAAAPGDAGWSLPVIYYHSKADAKADKSFMQGGRIVAGVSATGDFLFVSPGYTFATPVAGGQVAVSVAAAVGYIDASVEVTLTGPGGNPVSGQRSDSRTGLSDLYPTASLKWNRGVHNFVAYAMAGIPVGTYDQDRLANLGTNHWSLDGGGGYTFLDPQAGYEFSAVLGFSYSFENPATEYQNGVSAHLDWAASRFFSESFHAGLVGYAYQQLTGDSGAGAVLGDFKSRVLAIGPQAGLFFEVGDARWYANLKAYFEFSARHRPSGANVWAALAIPLGPPR